MATIRWKLLVLMSMMAVIVLIIIFGGKQGWGQEDRGDFKIGVVADDGIGIATVSRERNMINVLKVGGEVEVWIPKGLGWYRADKVGKILKEEKKEYLAEELFFYNFGLLPDNLVSPNKFANWSGKIALLKTIGVKNWIWYQWVSRNMLHHLNEIKQSLGNNPDLDEILLRDFADSRLVNRDVRVSVVNAAEVGGLAQFVADRLNWIGLSVVSTENGKDKYAEECRLELGSNLSTDSPEVVLMKKLWPCKVVEDKGLSENELLLTIGEKFPAMIKYLSYKN